MKSTPVEIVVLAPAWRTALKDGSRLARQAARAALHGAGAAQERRGIAIALGDDTLLQDLNRRYRGKDKSTNVLSFPADDPDRLGDVALALQTLKREAREQGKTLKAHFQHLVVHGTLHLLGHDHEVSAREAARMETLERQILAGLGVGDPYREMPLESTPKSSKIKAKTKR